MRISKRRRQEYEEAVGIIPMQDRGGLLGCFAESDRRCKEFKEHLLRYCGDCRTLNKLVREASLKAASVVDWRWSIKEHLAIWGCKLEEYLRTDCNFEKGDVIPGTDKRIDLRMGTCSFDLKTSCETTTKKPTDNDFNFAIEPHQKNCMLLLVGIKVLRMEESCQVYLSYGCAWAAPLLLGKNNSGKFEKCRFTTDGRLSFRWLFGENKPALVAEFPDQYLPGLIRNQFLDQVKWQ